jgi:hypothetical protein
LSEAAFSGAENERQEYQTYDEQHDHESRDNVSHIRQGEPTRVAGSLSSTNNDEGYPTKEQCCRCATAAIKPARHLPQSGHIET